LRRVLNDAARPEAGRCFALLDPQGDFSLILVSFFRLLDGVAHITGVMCYFEVEQQASS
jgi:hypothetical protein